jgi:2-methylisocitrate lyase-like PEP mutase family enzyme
MIRQEQRRKAELFRNLHRTPPILVLPNAWDVASARIFEIDGFQAIATSSAAVAATLGYPDGQRMSLEENLEVAKRIAGRVDVPVSVDLEAGYATTAEGIAESARAVVLSGAVGLNIEDGTGDASNPLFEQELQADKIRAIREVASHENVPLVINGRTDVYLVSGEPPAERLRHTVRRANAYLQAGADCAFIPDTGSLDAGTIARLVKEIDGPVNIIAGANTPPLPELESLGVARVSVGPRPFRALLALLKKIDQEWRERGTYKRMIEDTLTYAEVNEMFDGR